jgi:hypothetical protein
MTPHGFDLALGMVVFMACTVLAYDFMVSAASIWVKLSEPRTVGIFGALDLIGDLLDLVFGFMRWAMVYILVLAVVALLKLLEVHP